jgi:hypothetical protein
MQDLVINKGVSKTLTQRLHFIYESWERVTMSYESVKQRLDNLSTILVFYASLRSQLYGLPQFSGRPREDCMYGLTNFFDGKRLFQIFNMILHYKIEFVLRRRI